MKNIFGKQRGEVGEYNWSYFQTMEFAHLDLFEGEDEEEKVDAGAADR